MINSINKNLYELISVNVEKPIEEAVDDIIILTNRVTSVSDCMHKQSRKKYVDILSSRTAGYINRYLNERLIGMLLVTNKRYYNKNYETHQFIRYLIEDEEKLEPGYFDEISDIWWITNVGTDPLHRLYLGRSLVNDGVKYAITKSKSKECIVAMAIMTKNSRMQTIASDCGFTKVQRVFKETDFLRGGDYFKYVLDKENVVQKYEDGLEWFIFYQVLRTE